MSDFLVQHPTRFPVVIAGTLHSSNAPTRCAPRSIGSWRFHWPVSVPLAAFGSAKWPVQWPLPIDLNGICAAACRVVSQSTLTREQLLRACGGVHVQLTQFGYKNDPYMDSYTRRGIGAYHGLVADESVGLTGAAMRALGLSPAIIRRDHPWVNIQLKGGGTLHRRVDDTGPERNGRADLYMPGGLDSSLPDGADISLADGYVPRPMAARSSHHVTRRRHR